MWRFFERKVTDSHSLPYLPNKSRTFWPCTMRILHQLKFFMSISTHDAWWDVKLHHGTIFNYAAECYKIHFVFHFLGSFLEKVWKWHENGFIGTLESYIWILQHRDCTGPKCVENGYIFSRGFYGSGMRKIANSEYLVVGEAWTIEYTVLYYPFLDTCPQ